jgi:penicillin-binding protein 2B
MKKTANPQKNRKKMTRIMVGLTGLLFLVFIFRFSMIMITKKVNGENLSEHVNNLYTRSSILAAKRGTIYDIGGNPIALDATSYSLVAVLTDEWSEDTENPNHIVDKEKTAEVLAQYISMSEGEILTILNQADLKQVEFGSAGTNLNYATKSSIASAFSIAIRSWSKAYRCPFSFSFDKITLLCPAPPKVQST